MLIYFFIRLSEKSGGVFLVCDPPSPKSGGVETPQTPPSSAPLTGSPAYASMAIQRQQHNICNFEAMIRKEISTFLQRLEQMPSSIIKTIYQT